MNKRIIKKRNKAVHLKLVSQLPFTITNHTFGSGYFMLDMGPNAISWFWLKEFPSWKFGIWLRNNSFEIFGQAISMINKFKPSRSELCYKNDIDGFINELYKIKAVHPDWKEYIDSAVESEIYERRKRNFEQEIYQIIFNTSKSISNELFDIRIEDQNTRDFRVSPRYKVHEFIDEDFMSTQSSNDLLQISIKNYEILCRSLSNISEADINEFSFTDTYIFSSLGESIVAPEEYNRDAERYKWIDGTFEEHLQKIFDDNQEWKIGESQLKDILYNWKKDNYPDSPTIPGFEDALEHCYDGRYNPWLAKQLIKGMF